MSDYISGQFIYGDKYYTPEEYLDEKWLSTDVNGYYVSDKGRVWSERSERFISGNTNKNGYIEFTLKKGSKRIRRYLHRMIAEAFFRNDKNYPIVRHLDDNPSNNCVDNLAWGTQIDNMADARLNGIKMPSFRNNPELLEKAMINRRMPVVAKNIKTGEELYFISQQEAGRKLGIRQSDISSVINGAQKTAHEFTFRKG